MSSMGALARLGVTREQTERLQKGLKKTVFANLLTIGSHDGLATTDGQPTT